MVLYGSWVSPGVRVETWGTRLLLGVLLFGFESNLHIGPDARQRLWTVQMICIAISVAISPVLIPLRRILRDEHP